MEVISFINMKGGVAKTTLAINVVDCLCYRKGYKVLIIDVDPQFNATQCLLSANEYVEHIENEKDTIISVFDRSLRPTVGIVAGPKQATPKELEEITPLNLSGNMDLLPGSLDLFRVEMGSGEGREHRLKRYLETVGDRYDFVIIDTPPTPSVWMTSALLASDFYIIPVKPDPISLTGIDLLYGIINEKKQNFALNLKCLGLVLTMVESQTIVYKNARRNLARNKRWKDLVIDSYLPKATVIAREQLNRRTILDGNDPQLKRSIVKITNEIITRIEEYE